MHVQATDVYLHPDAQVICGKYAVSDDGLSVVNPVVALEAVYADLEALGG